MRPKYLNFSICIFHLNNEIAFFLLQSNLVYILHQENKDIQEPNIAAADTVLPIAFDDVAKYINTEGIRNYLFPYKRIMVDIVPYKLMFTVGKNQPLFPKRKPNGMSLNLQGYYTRYSNNILRMASYFEPYIMHFVKINYMSCIPWLLYVMYSITKTCLCVMYKTKFINSCPLIQLHSF